MALPKLQRFTKADYQPMSPRVQGLPRNNADKRGWGPGWPHAQGSKMVKVNANMIQNREFRGEVVPLIEYLIKASNALDYDLRPATEPDGGIGAFANRAIKNSRPPVASNHSWGLAIDQNTRGNARWTPFTSVTPPRVVTLWEDAGFFWGGRYGQGWEDPMHFEYLGKPSDVAQDLENAKASLVRIAGNSDLYPTQALGSRGTMVRVLRSRLGVHGFTTDTTLLDFDSFLDAVVKTFQRAKGLWPDGIVGPITWGELNTTP
jgi:hypothetical protein